MDGQETHSMTGAIKGDTTRNVEAEEVYRAAWAQYGFTTNNKARKSLEKVMDDAQVQIAYGPADSRWSSFIDTLPGFHEHWARLKVECDEMIRKRFG
jgi:hypothetical protein